MTNEIYLLLACTSYEGSSPMRAFVTKEDAEACKALCDAHAAEYPVSPTAVLEEPENDKEWDEWSAALSAWQGRHPVDAHWAGGWDSYAVTPLEIQDPLVAPASETAAGAVTDEQILSCRTWRPDGSFDKLAFARAILALATPPAATKPSDEELGRIAYKGYDDYWTEDCKGRDLEAWAASAKAVIAALAPQSPGVSDQGEA
jgi:hypothetical protein